MYHSYQSNRYISSLNLKFLDVKFIAINPHNSMETSMNSIRRSRQLQFPSIMKSIHDNSQNITMDDSIAITTKTHNAKNNSLLEESAIEEANDSENKEINKYRNMIRKVKSQNQLIHKQISEMYRIKKLGDAETNFKKVKRIEQLSSHQRNQDNHLIKKIKMNSLAQQYENIYQNLSGENNPYKKQTQQIKKKFSNNNLHKNFESFLIQKKKRIPEFVKNIR